MGDVSMDKFLKVFGVVLGALLMLAVAAGVWALVAWIVKLVWQA